MSVTREFYARSNALFNRAVAENIINPQPDRIQELVDTEGSILLPLMDTARKQRAQNLVDSPWLGQQSSWQLPTTRRYLQSKAPPGPTPSVQPEPGLDWLVELARWAVPFGSIGILKSFEQYLAAGGTTWSSSEHWGNPFGSSDVRWFFRLSPITKVSSPWINISGLGAIPDYLPGSAYDDFERTNDIWFPAGSSASANIHLPIPGGFVLRLVAIVSASQSAVSIAAKVSGTVQTETNDSAQFVVRTTW